MVDGVDSCLLFFSAGSHFPLPPSYIKQVTDMKKREPEMTPADFLELSKTKNLSGQACLIIAGCGDGGIGIGAEIAAGLVQVEEEQVYVIPKTTRGNRNQYMDRMMALGAEEERGRLASVMVPPLLIPQPVL